MKTKAMMAMSAIGTAVSTIGSMQQAQSAKRAAAYEAAIAEQQADRERKIGELNAKRYKRDAMLKLGKQRALMAASGVEVNSGGTAGLLQVDAAEEAELQRLLIKNNAEVEATRLEQKANLFRMKGEAQAKSSMFGAGTRLLSGAGSIVKTSQGGRW